VYDVDGDEGRTTGYLGVLFLGHTTDPNGEFAPRRVGVSTYSNFSGSASFEDGGDPTNDFERYELLSRRHRARRDDPSRLSNDDGRGPVCRAPAGQHARLPDGVRDRRRHRRTG